MKSKMPWRTARIASNILEAIRAGVGLSLGPRLWQPMSQLDSHVIDSALTRGRTIHTWSNLADRSLD